MRDPPRNKMNTFVLFADARHRVKSSWLFRNRLFGAFLSLYLIYWNCWKLVWIRHFPVCIQSIHWKQRRNTDFAVYHDVKRRLRISALFLVFISKWHDNFSLTACWKLKNLRVRVVSFPIFWYLTVANRNARQLLKINESNNLLKLIFYWKSGWHYFPRKYNFFPLLWELLTVNKPKNAPNLMKIHKSTRKTFCNC